MMDTVGPEQERINRQLMDLGRAMRSDDQDEVMRITFNLLADGLGAMLRCASALERIETKLDSVISEG